MLTDHDRQNELTIVIRDVDIYVNLYDISEVDGWIDDIEKIYVGPKRREISWANLRQAHRWQIENAILSWYHDTRHDMDRRYILAPEKPGYKDHCAYLPTRGA